ncbi:hypothetical protein BXZ70DRAFT_997414 [Cristinia sonorae]|uniref:GDP/GTP exchange factor Sec2 N-terminal domain-containing protein n=1 Tax=Cristinia sonorae TaxID=1940300 RepID=A0A8K0UXX9_9AGAR|nr:hypothetical protein BXZ70DRAFT_997414 [Cristinia sonorae]
MFSSGRNALPRRTDSLTVAASAASKFNEIEDELHDIRRVHTHGQEEDLKMALSRTITRVEELSSLLKEAYRVQTDLQTELTLAKSNLQLALANNEMLEDALNRDVPGSSKDVGWRRWGAKEQKEREMDSRRSIDSSHSLDVSPAQSPIPGSATPADGRFFKFRFGSGATSASAASSTFPSPTTRFPASPRLGEVKSASASGQFHSSHLTSASLPSLIPDREKEFETLTAELEKEKKAHAAASAAKEALEAELESLSQALFEEANKMVATERMKLADREEELRETQAEKEALRSALKLLEQERRASMRQADLDEDDRISSPSSQPVQTHGRSLSTVSAFSASSAMGIKSPPSLSAPASPVSARRVLLDAPSSASTVVPTPTSAVSQIQRHDEQDRVGSESPVAEITAQNDDPSTKQPPEPQASTPQTKTTSSLTPDPSSASLSPSPQPSPSNPSSNNSPSPSGFTYIQPRPMTFFGDDDTESPWADVRSATASPVAGGF